MSCQYFILSKSKDKKIDDISDQTFIVLPNKNNYLLPYNNVSYYLTNGLFENTLIEWCKQFGDREKVILVHIPVSIRPAFQPISNTFMHLSLKK